MHKGFYASGFLYNPDSEQILLQQQLSSLTSSWSLFENTYIEEDKGQETFTKTIKQLLHVRLDSIHPVYSYIDEVLGKNQYVFYAVCYKTKPLKNTKDQVTQWFSFKEVTKLNIPEQIRHDIIVGQRVIEAAGRKSRGEHTL